MEKLLSIGMAFVPIATVPEEDLPSIVPADAWENFEYEKEILFWNNWRIKRNYDKEVDDSGYSSVYVIGAPCGIEMHLTLPNPTIFARDYDLLYRKLRASGRRGCVMHLGFDINYSGNVSSILSETSTFNFPSAAIVETIVADLYRVSLLGL